MIVRAGRVPVLLDWDGRSPLPDQRRIFCPRVGDNDIWGGFGSGDAETIAALVQASEVFVGIDSGPGKAASATTTPTLIIWVGHHPIQFHDPAANTVHLIPETHRDMPPCRDDRRIADWFEKNYAFFTYDGPHGLVRAAQEWLCKILKSPEARASMSKQFVLPGGIGDVTWALLKIRSIAGENPIDVIVSGDPKKEVDNRALPFLRRFDFVRGVRVQDVPVLVDKENANDDQGRYRYVADGEKGDFHFLVPNTTLERGERIETWLSDHPADWEIFQHFSWENTERGLATGQALEPFAAFYLGPESGNIEEGHNRGWLWEPKHWIELGKMLTERGLNVAVVGAPYDRSFWEKYVRDGVKQAGQHWFDLIGRFEIGETFACLKKAKVVVSYQSGLAIVAHYLGVPVVTWWREDGNSAHPKRKVCFDNRMKDAWIRPGWEDRYMGCLYQRETVGDIMAEIDRRGWLGG